MQNTDHSFMLYFPLDPAFCFLSFKKIILKKFFFW